MVIALHNLACNYKLLPSEALERATTFDLYVLDVYNRRQIYEQERAEAESKGSAPPIRKIYSTEEMLDMLKRARGEDTNVNKKTN